MSETDAKPRKLVREFRQILVWPIQLMPLREGAQIQEHWEALSQPGADHPWRELRDEFSCDPAQFQQRHYSEFVTFLPYVRRFLYGEGKGRTGAGIVDSPIRVFRRNDVAALRATLPGAPSAPLTLNVAHVDLCFFYDIDVVILIVEVFAHDLTLTQALDVLHRFGRGYPTYWHDDDTGGHCLVRAEWIGRDGAVLATSDYEARSRYLEFVGRYRAPRFASHWTWLMKPLVPDHSDEKGLIRFRQIEYSRMPVLAYVAMDNARELTRADFVRLGLVTGAGTADDEAPYSSRYLRDFEERYCYDQFWNDDRAGRPGTRLMSCGHAFVMVGDAGDPFFVDREFGLLGQFRHQYFLLFLIPHIHKATLLMLSDRMVDALNHLDIRDAESVKRFKRTIRQLREIFLRFTHRYWFHEVSDQPQAKELYRMTSNYLGSDRLYDEIHQELGDMSDYLESDTLRRQANTVVRLTVVTTFGLVGTVVTGFLGMNLIALAEAPFSDKVGYFLLVLVPTTLLTFYTIVKSKRLSDFLEALSDERLPAAAKFKSLLDVWKSDKPPRTSRARPNGDQPVVSPPPPERGRA
ncbi:MAG TPA: CorA family divalent cation transporter [Casimicrobiaceae bacterium]|nr:CorA family divalent cation transporter [Casimicrobiaceae bacterium]